MTARVRPLRVHVVGCSPRSGTTLMHALLTQAYGLAGVHDHERSLVAPPPGPGACCTKMPHELALARLLLAWWPRLHVVYLRRDPRDVITSHHRRNPAVYWTPLRLWQRNEKLARRLVGHARFHVVRYEGLMRDPVGVQATLEARIPLPPRQREFAAYPWNGAPLHARSAEALGSVRVLDHAGIGRWRTHLARIKGQVLQHGSPAADLVRLGYEPDQAWERLLDDVTPDLAPSHWPEHVSWRQRQRRRVRTVWRAARFVLAGGLGAGR